MLWGLPCLMTFTRQWARVSLVIVTMHTYNEDDWLSGEGALSTDHTLQSPARSLVSVLSKGRTRKCRSFARRIRAVLKEIIPTVVTSAVLTRYTTSQGQSGHRSSGFFFFFLTLLSVEVSGLHPLITQSDHQCVQRSCFLSASQLCRG